MKQNMMDLRPEGFFVPGLFAAVPLCRSDLCTSRTESKITQRTERGFKEPTGQTAVIRHKSQRQMHLPISQLHTTSHFVPLLLLFPTLIYS